MDNRVGLNLLYAQVTYFAANVSLMSFDFISHEEVRKETFNFMHQKKSYGFPKHSPTTARRNQLSGINLHPWSLCRVTGCTNTTQ